MRTPPWPPSLPLVALALVATADGQAPGTPTLELARLQKGVKSRRVSSYDTTGGNNDRLEGLAPGERARRSSTSRARASSTTSG